MSWDREDKNPKVERKDGKDGYEAHRFKFKAPYGPKVLLYLPIWWCLEFWWLLRKRWDIVHAMDFDTVVPAVIAARIKRKPVIYELGDIYEDMIPLPQMLRKICAYIDKIFMRLANAVIIAHEAQVKELSGIPNKNVVAIYNSPPDFFKKINSAIQKDDKFTIFYAGKLYKARRLNLDKVFQAIKNINIVRLIITGYGDQVDEINTWADEFPDKVEFIGRLSYTEVLERTMMADLLINPREPTVHNRCTIPNKPFEAMMCGKPILVSKGTAMADMVEEENCGLVVDCNTAEKIREAIIRLKESPELRQQLGANGRRAYEQRYSWAIMEQRLLALYREIGKKLKVNPLLKGPPNDPA